MMKNPLEKVTHYMHENIFVWDKSILQPRTSQEVCFLTSN